MSAFVGIIRVLTTDGPQLLMAHGRQMERLFPVRTISKCIPDQPRAIYDEESRLRAVPKIVHLGRQLAREGASALVVTCADDPGVAELRGELGIPVIGAGSAVAGIASALAGRVAVLNMIGATPGPIRRVLGKRMVAEAGPAELSCPTDLSTSEGRQAALVAGVSVARTGADALVLACTTYSTIGLAHGPALTSVHSSGGSRGRRRSGSVVRHQLARGPYCC